MVSILTIEFTMPEAQSSPTPDEACLLCRRTLGDAALRMINGEPFCEEDAEHVVTYGLIGAACKRQMDLALHAIAHGQRNIDGLYEELTALFEKYRLIERGFDES